MSNQDPIIEVPAGKTVYVFLPDTVRLGYIKGPVTLEIHNTGEDFITHKCSYVCTNKL